MQKRKTFMNFSYVGFYILLFIIDVILFIIQDNYVSF